MQTKPRHSQLVFRYTCAGKKASKQKHISNNDNTVCVSKPLPLLYMADRDVGGRVRLGAGVAVRSMASCARSILYLRSSTSRTWSSASRTAVAFLMSWNTSCVVATS